MQEEKESSSKVIAWLKRIGVIGFLFFLIKGLLWLFLGKTMIDFFKNL